MILSNAKIAIGTYVSRYHWMRWKPWGLSTMRTSGPSVRSGESSLSQCGQVQWETHGCVWTCWCVHGPAIHA